MLFYLSGKSPRKAIAAETNRFIFLDGTIEDLGKGIPAVLMPVISDNYSKYIGWKGQGEIPAEKLEKVREYIRQTHAEGKLFRWWGAPDTPLFKKLFIKEGVDLIYANFKSFLTQNGVKEIETENADFDTDIHEAVTTIPAPTPELRVKCWIVSRRDIT